MENLIVELEDGLVVLAIGFSTVFVFLVVLIFSMEIMAKIIAYINKLFPVLVPQAASSKQVKPAGDEEVAVAVACALLKQNHG